MEKVPDEPIDEQEPEDDEDESVTLEIQSSGHGQEARS